MKDFFNGHFARKRFGQNFLTDKRVIADIIDAIDPLPEQLWLEIGPGRGALTLPLLTLVKKLIAVELDRDLIPLLAAAAKNKGELIIHQMDALKFQLSTVTTQPHSLHIVGNLPYNISSPLLFHLLQQQHWIQEMYFMLQHEVVNRIVAEPSTANYGRLSIMVQYHCQVEKLFVIGPEAFSPAPKIYSAMVKLVPYQQKPFIAKNPQLFNQLVRQAFSQRRKTLKNALQSILSAEQLVRVGIDPKARPENLSIADYVRISDTIDSNYAAEEQLKNESTGN